MSHFVPYCNKKKERNEVVFRFVTKFQKNKCCGERHMCSSSELKNASHHHGASIPILLAEDHQSTMLLLVLPGIVSLDYSKSINLKESKVELCSFSQWTSTVLDSHIFKAYNCKRTESVWATTCHFL